MYLNTQGYTFYDIALTTVTDTSFSSISYYSINDTTPPPTDTTPPSANITNINASQSIKINSRLNITATLTDETALSKANITFNLTGLNDFYNFSFALSGTTALISQNITVNLTRGNVINATVSVTDTSGNIGENSTLITVANSLPSVASAAINNTLPSALEDLQ